MAVTGTEAVEVAEPMAAAGVIGMASAA